MNNVAPWRRLTSLSCASSAPGSTRMARAPSQVLSAGRARSVGRSSTGRLPWNLLRQNSCCAASAPVSRSSSVKRR